MSTPDTEPPRWNPKFRKRRKLIGDEFIEAVDAVGRNLVSTKDKGLLCKECHKRIGWKKLKCSYESRVGALWRLWWCECGNMIKEEQID